MHPTNSRVSRQTYLAVCHTRAQAETLLAPHNMALQTELHRPAVSLLVMLTMMERRLPEGGRTPVRQLIVVVLPARIMADLAQCTGLSQLVHRGNRDRWMQSTLY